MASNSQEYGYDDERFQNVVNPNFHCSICLNVLKEPKTCRNNEHLFCTNCIHRHLANSPTCPECMQELTVQTLNQAPRVLMNYLSELNISCEYNSRGCREFTQLGNLNTHVLNCGFGPVRCTNEGCVVEINKRDRIYHETEVCEFRRVRCHDCGEIRKSGDELKKNQAKLMEDVAEVKEDLTEIKQNQAEVKEDLAELKRNQAEVKRNQAELKENQAELKQDQAEMKEQLNQLPFQLNEVKDMLVAVLNKLHNEEKIQSPLHVEPAKKQDVIIAGGRNTPFQPTRSVESFSWEEGVWAQLPAMEEPRSHASLCVHENQVIVSGGFTACFVSTDSMEILKTAQEPLQWIASPAKLPAKLCGHTTAVHENRLLAIGGYNGTEGIHSNAIHEVSLIPPYSTKLLRRMPQPREYHGTELVNNKIFILGGRTSNSSKDVIDSVIVYDVVNNQCLEMRPLPFAVFGMATVSWRNKIILIGGRDKNDQDLNDVIMYDIESGESERLPSMKYKREGCSAVVTGDVMVVMGGWNREGCLNSVECFSFSSNSWKELPAMMEARGWATAVVKHNNID